MLIRPATDADGPAIWAILKPVFRAGDTYTIDPGISENDALAYWMRGNHRSFVAEVAGEVLGTYYICRNWVGYNFSDFSDDLTQLDYKHQGLFINLIGKY